MTFEEELNEAREEGREEGRKEGRKEGREEGRKEGREEARQEMMENIFFAFAMFRNGKSDEEIFQTERFSSMEQIRELRKKWRDSCVAA